MITINMLTTVNMITTKITYIIIYVFYHIKGEVEGGKTCTGMVTATLFIISKTWKQPRCPSVGK